MMKKIRIFMLKKKDKCGFTLLEMLLVLALISLIVGITSVHYVNNLPSARLQSTARELAAALRSIKVSARLNHEPKALVLDLNTRQYYVSNNQVKTIPADIWMKVVDSASEEKLEGKHEIVFEPEGATECGRIVLWNERKSVSIQIDPVIGAVVIR